MPPLHPGKGYWVCLTENDILTYPSDEHERIAASLVPSLHSKGGVRGGQDLKSRCYDPIQTEQNMSLLITGEELLPGDEVVAFNSFGNVVGSSVVDPDGWCGMALWGRAGLDKSAPTRLTAKTTPPQIGLKDNEIPEFKVRRGSNLFDATVDVREGSIEYEANSFAFAELYLNQMSMVKTFALFEPYPNPFNDQSLIRFQINVSGPVLLGLYDTNGKQLRTVLKGHLERGIHQVQLNAEGLSSGLYLIKLKSEEGTATRKIILMR